MLKRWALALSIFPFSSADLWPQRPLFTNIHETFPATPENTLSLAIGDIDGDGDEDVFAGNALLQSSRLYRNDGGGTFCDITATNLPPTTRTASAAFVDVDGDGVLELFLGTDSSAPDQLYENDGSGVFVDVSATHLPSTSLQTVDADFADVDGDGDLDAFLACQQPSNRLFANDGTGVFADVSAQIPVKRNRDVSMADVDGDGDLDAFAGGSFEVNLYLNDGTGVFSDATSTHLPSLVANVSTVATGDVDGDGDEDAVVGTSRQNLLYENDGTGVFTDVTAGRMPVDSDRSVRILMLDVDADGDTDIVLANDDGEDRLYENDGAGVFTDVSATKFPTQPDGDTLDVASADVDGDGDVDLLTAHQFFDGNPVNKGARNRLFLNDGTGTFVDANPPLVPRLLDFTPSVALADLDGDGDLDAFTGNAVAVSLGFSFPLDPQNRVYLNDGSGVFADNTATSLPAVADPTTECALADLDGDGDVDVVVANRDQNRLYLNDGRAVFTDVTSTHLPAISHETWALALGDVDADGDLDIYLGNGIDFPAMDALYRNDGSGVFTDVTASSLPPVAIKTRAVAFADVDGDGDLDAFVGQGVSNSQDMLFLNDGSGVFVDASATNLPPTLDNTLSVSMGDVDGDGDIDVYVGNLNSQALYLNDGNGVFTDVTALHFPQPSNLSGLDTALADVDNDGDLDALSASFDRTYLHQNDGHGVFMDVTVLNVRGHTFLTDALAVGDLDQDGDLDFVTGNRGVNSVFTNQLRQLSWRGMPRIGKPMTLDVIGEGKTFALHVAATPATIPLGPYGTLRLAPSTTVLAAVGSLNDSGRAAVNFPIPNVTTLVGRSLYWQAITSRIEVVPPFVLSNLEISTFRDL